MKVFHSGTLHFTTIMTAVQKRQSRQQTLSLSSEPIAYRSGPSQLSESTDRKLQSQQTDCGRSRVPRTFFSRPTGTIDLPIMEGTRLPPVQTVVAGAGDHHSHRQQPTSPRHILAEARHQTTRHRIEEEDHTKGSARDPSLQHLAAGALQAVTPARDMAVSLPNLANDISISTRKLSLRDEPLPSLAALSRETSIASSHMEPTASSPPSLLTSTTGELPPLQMDSPKSDGYGQSLPSIRSTFGDINRIASEIPPLEKGNPISPTQSSNCPGSPPIAAPRLPPISANPTSPPVSPNDTYNRSMPSPHSVSSNGNYGYPPPYHASGGPSYDKRTAGETDATLSPSSSASAHINVEIVPNGPSYVCTFDGCNAHPFQTQYLLNSHANVHSSSRPHYCPVKGCPRSEGGKGFKRKNEMIRHGLVHDSPGYVCPFCPNREHKYPRPDNLQR